MASKPVVILVNPNKVHPGIAPYALDILTTALEAHGFAVLTLDLTFHREHWEEFINQFFHAVRVKPILIGVTIRNTDTVYAQQQQCFLEEHKAVIRHLRIVCSGVPIIAGGIGFSTMPFALVDFFDLDFGCKGPGEHLIVRLAKELCSQKPNFYNVPGLLINTRSQETVIQVPWSVDVEDSLGDPKIPQERVITSQTYSRRSYMPFYVDNYMYYDKGGLGSILSRNGCANRCSFCAEPDAKNSHYSFREVPIIVDEMESLLKQGIFDIHSADSEFNIPIEHSKQVLREIIARKSNSASHLWNLRFWIYLQPTHETASEEYVQLLKDAGVTGANVSLDHTDRCMLKSWKLDNHSHPLTNFEDAKLLVLRLRAAGIMCMTEVLFCMPGETVETMRKVVNDVLQLECDVYGFACGIRLFPNSPFGIQMAEKSAGVTVVPGIQSDKAKGPIVLKPKAQCSSQVEYERQFVWDEAGNERPLFYFADTLPEEPEVFSSANGKYLQTVRLLHDMVPLDKQNKCMLPTVEGQDNNYVEMELLENCVKLGYRGAFWSLWAKRFEIIAQAH